MTEPQPAFEAYLTKTAAVGCDPIKGYPLRMAEPAAKRMSLAEFLEWDDGTDTRYELIDGRPRAMAPPIEAHGTIVSGEIAAELDNGIGGAGVAPRAKVIPAKFLGPDDGSTADAIRAIDYLTDLKVRHGVNIVATNNSYEGDDEQSHALQAAIQ